MASDQSPSFGSRQQIPLRINLFGPFRVWVDGQEVPHAAWKRRSAASLVKILALTPTHRLPRDQLMEYLWPDSDPAQATNNLYQALHVARRALGGDLLLLRDQIARFSPQVTLEVDTQIFEEAVQYARRCGDAAAYRAALSLFTDTPLADDPYDSWALTARESLREIFTRAALELAAIDDGSDGHEALVAALRKVISDDPLHEPAQRAYLSTLARTGQRHQALRHYDEFRQALREELGVEPELQTQNLVARIRAGDFERSGSAEPSIYRVQSARNNLPAPVSRFIGRSREVSEIQRLVRGTRLVTLTGPGGCGKTRLALEVARNLTAQFADGVYLVELASLSDPDLIPQEIVSSLGIREAAGQPLMHLLTNWLRDRQVLLVLDNCEHLIDTSAVVVDALLRASAGLHVLATSREPLRVSGESTWIVPSLSLPDPSIEYDPDSLLEFEAVQLFLDRGAQVAAGFTLTPQNAADVAELCYRLDGIPLALELAAARVRSLTVGEIVERLDDRFKLLKDGSRAALSRHQTLQAALGWSYDLLSQKEQRLFTRLSVFSNGFTLDAAESVCSIEPLERSDILDLLTGLVDRSLVIASESDGRIRYLLLETMRQYARERLHEMQEEQTIARAHANYFADVVERGSQDIRGRRQREWIARLEAEHDNLRVALDWLQAQESPQELEQALLLAGRLRWFWHLKGHFTEGQARLKQLIAAGEQPSSGYATALTGLGTLALAIGDYETSRSVLERSTALWRTIGDTPGLALALSWRGWERLFHGSIADARSDHQEALTLFTAVEDHWGIALSNLGLGFDAAELNEIDRARSHFDVALEIFREIGDEWGIATTLQQLAHLTYRASDFTAAMSQVTELLAVEQRMGDVWLVVTSQGLLTEIARAAGDIETAETSAEICLGLAWEMGHVALRAWALRDIGFVELARGNAQRARANFLEALTLFRERNYPLGIACCAVGLASVAAAQAELEKAAYVLGAVDAELDRIHISLAPADRLAREQLMESIRESIDGETFERAYQRGILEPISDAVACLTHP